MDSDSTIIMIKALLLSLAIHLIFLLILGHVSFSVPEIPDFSRIRVTFGNAAVLPSSESGQNEKKAEVTVEQSIPEKPPAHPPAELPSEPAAESVSAPVAILVEERVEQVEITEDSDVQSQISDVATVDRSEELSDAIGGNGGELPATADEISSGSAETGGAEGARSGESEIPDVSWEGGALYPRSIPEPRFTIPYSASLPEHINIRFSVQHDGTVISIRLLPPGSGHIDLDRQIRAYVADFLFEEFDSSEDNRRGILTLYLKAMGNPGI